MTDSADKQRAAAGPKPASRMAKPDPAAPRTQNAPGAGTGGAGVVDLVRQLADDVAVLLRKELALASAEIRGWIDDAKSGVVGMLGGGIDYLGGVDAPVKRQQCHAWYSVSRSR